jgi:hypothetical protein
MRLATVGSRVTAVRKRATAAPLVIASGKPLVNAAVAVRVMRS